VPARAFRLAVTFGLAVMLTPPLTGCALLIDKQPPAAIEPASHYRAKLPGKNGVVPAPDWWTAFKSRELSGLVERAQGYNHDIAAAVARIDQADAQLRATQTLFLPSGGFDANRTSFRQSAAAVGAPVKLPGQHVSQIDISAAYQIDFWGKNAALVRASEATALSSRFNRDVVELTVVATVINTYFQVLFAQDQLRIYQDNLRVARSIREIINKRLDAGTSTRIDLAQQDYVVAQLESIIPQIRTVLAQNDLTLGVLVGEVPEKIAVRGGSLERLKVPAVDPGLPSELLLQRPDIRRAELQLSAASSTLASAKVSLLPSFSLTGQRGYESAVLKTLITPQAIFYNVAANATQPIFDLPNLLAQIALQEGVEKELLERYRQAILSGFTDVERALVSVRESAQQERLTRNSLTIAQRSYDLSESQLNAGNIDLTTMLNIQRTLFEAQSAVINARLLRFQAALNLYQALGGGWKADPLPLREAAQQKGEAAVPEPAEAAN
jgi:NodT family efflux transporter outer membrane factor (OMF) lipoprotein